MSLCSKLKQHGRAHGEHVSMDCNPAVSWRLRDEGSTYINTRYLLCSGLVRYCVNTTGCLISRSKDLTALERLTTVRAGSGLFHWIDYEMYNMERPASLEQLAWHGVVIRLLRNLQ